MKLLLLLNPCDESTLRSSDGICIVEKIAYAEAVYKRVCMALSISDCRKYTSSSLAILTSSQLSCSTLRSDAPSFLSDVSQSIICVLQSLEMYSL